MPTYCVGNLNHEKHQGIRVLATPIKVDKPGEREQSLCNLSRLVQFVRHHSQTKASLSINLRYDNRLPTTAVKRTSSATISRFATHPDNGCHQPARLNIEEDPDWLQRNSFYFYLKNDS